MMGKESQRKAKEGKEKHGLARLSQGKARCGKSDMKRHRKARHGKASRRVNGKGSYPAESAPVLFFLASPRRHSRLYQQ
jgi:hypothetical protein